MAMKNAVRFAAEEAGVPPSSLRIWLDMSSIPQTNPAVQKQVIASLPVFASVVDMFIVVAPNCRHTHTMKCCDAASYRARGWCRAEMFSCWARNGHSSMFYATNRGLEKLARSDEALVSAIDTFGGAFTCCARGHDDGGSCDREALMLPLLGIWAEVYRGRKDARRKAYKALAPRLDELFPATAKFTVADGEPEERVLFGDLVEAVVYYEDLDASFPGDEIRNKPTPDFRPGTSGLPRVAQRGRSVARSAARPSMRSMLSSLTRSTKTSRHSSSDTHHGLSPLSTSRSLPQALTRDSSLGGSSSKSPNSLVWTASAPRPVQPPTPRNEDRV